MKLFKIEMKSPPVQEKLLEAKKLVVTTVADPSTAHILKTILKVYEVHALIASV